MVCIYIYLHTCLYICVHVHVRHIATPLRWPVPCETPSKKLLCCKTQVVDSFNRLFDEGVLVRTPTGESTRVFCAVVQYQGDWKWHKDSGQGAAYMSI